MSYTTTVKLTLQEADAPVAPDSNEENSRLDVKVPDTGHQFTLSTESGLSLSNLNYVLPIAAGIIAVVIAVAAIAKLAKKKHSKNFILKGSLAKTLGETACAILAVAVATYGVTNLINAVNASSEPDYLVINNEIELVGTPGQFTYACQQIKAGEDLYDNYGLSIRATNTASLVKEGSNSTIAITDGSTLDNTWGYLLSDGTEPTAESAWKATVTEGTYIRSYDASSDGNNVATICYGVQTDEDQELGTYTATVEFGSRCWDKPTLQEASYQSTLNNASLGDITTLCDTRDGKDYTVGKLNDNQIWFLENLKLGSKTETIRLTSNDSAIRSGVEFELPASTTNWDAYEPNIYIGNATGYEGEVYYDWRAMTANVYNEADASRLEVSSSICPKGWRLPEVNHNNNNDQVEINDLLDTYDNFTSFKNAFRLKDSGLYDSEDKTIEGAGEAWGLIWGDTAHWPEDGINYWVYLAYYNYSENTETPYINDGYSELYDDDGIVIRCVLQEGQR